jgi:RNA polymerase sigma-70 factor (ECF subfamily)
MSQDSPFTTLIRRVRAGEADAAAELVRQYEPQIRRMVRLRLTDPRLNRVLDSMDICQSVMANFFVRAAAGQFDLEEPGQLLKLLASMARNKLLNQAEKYQAQRRDQRRVQADGGAALDAVADRAASPSQIVAGAELLQQVRLHLTDDERYLAEQRALGQDWNALAVELGSSPEALRKKLARAVDRVMRRLGLDEGDHE